MVHPPEYKWNASEYIKHSTPQRNWGLELIEKLNLKGTEHVLDIGCGTGKVTAEIAMHVPKGSVVGIDNSEEMLAFAREEFTPELFPNLTFVHMDARWLTFEQKFDVVFSNASLHWLTDHRAALQGMHRVLDKGGRLLLQMGGHGNAAAVVKAFESVMEREEWKKYFKNFEFPYGFFSPIEYAPWLTDVGFTILRLELIGKDMTHESVDSFKGWVRATWLPYVNRVPKKKREAFIDEAVGEYLAANPANGEGIIHTAMKRLEVEATS